MGPTEASPVLDFWLLVFGANCVPCMTRLGRLPRDLEMNFEYPGCWRGVYDISILMIDNRYTQFSANISAINCTPFLRR